MRLRCIAVLCVLLAAAGCGQKGPLYLPGDPNEGRIVLPTEELPDGNGDDEAGAVEDEQADPTGPEEPAVEDDEQSGEQ